MNTPGNIRRLPELEETRSEQLAPPSLLIRTAELRDTSSRLAQDAAELHVEEQAAALERRASLLAQEEPSELLRRVGLDFGFSWATVAKLIGVSPTAIRKWRRGDAITPENRRQLARVIAFCEFLMRVDPRITDPSLWLEIPVSSETTLTHAALFARGMANDLLDLAAGRITPQGALATFDPDWRDRFAPDVRWEVVIAEDGLPSIVPRE